MTTVARLHLIILVLLVAGGGKIATAQEDFSKVYEKANKAVVLIGFEDGAREVGSGVVVGVTENGAALVLTANHVVEGYETVTVSFAGDIDQHRTGVVSGTLFSEAEDMAIVVVQNPPSGIEVIRLRESPGKKGESVGTIGHPLGEAFTWSNGSISNVHGKHIVHDARLQRGSSGGPLLDGCSRLLGMNIQIIDTTTDSDSLPPTDMPEGTSIALAATSVASVLDGWFADTRFEEKWTYKKYCSFWERLYKQPVVLVGEAAVIAGSIYWLVTSGDDGTDPDPLFDEPPNPPNGQ
jgi:S1-C subfamily serine protease